MVPTNSGKWQREDFLDLVLFCMCFLMTWTSFHKHDTANWIYVTIHARNHIKASNALPDVWNICQEKLKKRFMVIWNFTFCHIWRITRLIKFNSLPANVGHVHWLRTDRTCTPPTLPTSSPLWKSSFCQQTHPTAVCIMFKGVPYFTKGNRLLRQYHKIKLI